MKLRRNFNSEEWAQENFGECSLGDTRRVKRLVTVARQMADRPAASLPKVGEDWAGTRGLYRLLDCEQATLESVTRGHRARTTAQEGEYLVVSDTSHIDMGWNRKLPDAGSVGPGRSQGFLLHSGLLIDAKTGRLEGLAGQTAHVRPAGTKGRQNTSKRLKRWRESEMWPELMEQVGSPPEGAKYIHVCDSAADNFEVFATAVRLKGDFVIRVGRLNRNVRLDGGKMSLKKAISKADEVGRYKVFHARGNGRKARSAELVVSVAPVELPVPRRRGPRIKRYVKEGGGDISVSVVVVKEVDPPDGVKPVVLLTTIPIECYDDAKKVIGWYENRWIVEEWHKALKTGCQLESRQLQSVDRLLPLAGVSSVIAVLLVQLKDAARTEPNEPASERVPRLWIELLRAKKKIRPKDEKERGVTNRIFWHSVAKLGGFLGRKGDGEPGWQTIWRGWRELHTLAEGAELAKKCG